MKTRSIEKLLIVLTAIVACDRTSVAQSVTSVIDTGSYNILEMSIDPTSGDIYCDGTSSGSSELSIVKVTGSTLTTIYPVLPATTGGNLQSTSGFAVHGSDLWWNNPNAGPGTNTELSR